METYRQVAIIGTQGVPAKYGGFETLVENIIGENCSPNVRYTVFCSGTDMPDRPTEYKGVRLKYINLKANGSQSIPYDIISMCKAIKGYDTLLILGVSGCLFLPLLRLLTRARIVVNIDGLEHRRAKWGKMTRLFLRASERFAVMFAHTVITDNKGIQDYVTSHYKKPSEMIAYGGDHVKREVSAETSEKILATYGLRPKEYAITVCRIEPENNCHVIMEAFSKSDRLLFFIGNWEHSNYARALRQKYAHCKNILTLNAVYDLDTLYVLRRNARCYIHGHSAGGTNPSLVEAMFFGNPILCYNVVYNRETTHAQAAYWNNADDLLALLNRDDLSGDAIKTVAEENYTWASIAHAYEQLY